jgi:flagella basal body P-ring formation protein FlgA
MVFCVACATMAQDWRVPAAAAAEAVYRARGVVVQVHAQLLASSIEITEAEGLRLREVRSDVLHGKTLLFFEGGKGYPVLVTSQQVLPELSREPRKRESLRKGWLVRAGERRRWTLNDGAMTMQLEGMALASARVGDVMSLRLDAAEHRIVRLRLRSATEAEVVR